MARRIIEPVKRNPDDTQKIIKVAAISAVVFLLVQGMANRVTRSSVIEHNHAGGGG